MLLVATDKDSLAAVAKDSLVAGSMLLVALEKGSLAAVAKDSLVAGDVDPEIEMKSILPRYCTVKFSVTIYL